MRLGAAFPWATRLQLTCRVEHLHWDKQRPQWGVVTTALKKGIGGVLFKIAPATLEITLVEGFEAPITPLESLEEQLLMIQLAEAPTP